MVSAAPGSQRIALFDCASGEALGATRLEQPLSAPPAFDARTASLYAATVGGDLLRYALPTESLRRLTRIPLIDSPVLELTVIPTLPPNLQCTRCKGLPVPDYLAPLHQAYVASGAMIGAFTVSAKLWDIAAGSLLVQQAGGVVKTLDGQSPFPIDIKQYKTERFRLLSANQKSYCEIAKIFETTCSKMSQYIKTLESIYC